MQAFRDQSLSPVYSPEGVGDHQVLLAVYVDDQIIISKSLHQVHQVKKAMSQAFDIKDLGDASCVLGISIIMGQREAGSFSSHNLNIWQMSSSSSR